MRVATGKEALERSELKVSTHATRAGRDLARRLFQRVLRRFNSRDPCGSRRPRLAFRLQQYQFQLTRPVRVATTSCPLSKSSDGRCVGRDCRGRWSPAHHRPQHCCSFQLTRPVRVATNSRTQSATLLLVSTHATRAGRDEKIHCHAHSHAGFNSRDPCGSRPRLALIRQIN